VGEDGSNGQPKKPSVGEDDSNQQPEKPSVEKIE
jgi:hypothetical protein